MVSSRCGSIPSAPYPVQEAAYHCYPFTSAFLISLPLSLEINKLVLRKKKKKKNLSWANWDLHVIFEFSSLRLSIHTKRVVRFMIYIKNFISPLKNLNMKFNIKGICRFLAVWKKIYFRIMN